MSLCVGWKITKSLPLVTGFGGFALGSFIFRMQDEYGNFQFEKFAGRGWFRDETDMIQQTNEAGGLFIVALWVFILAFMLKKQQKAAKQDA